jgi:hypothetical protein
VASATPIDEAKRLLSQSIEEFLPPAPVVGELSGTARSIHDERTTIR